jgi:AraC family transcriptional regulator
MNSKNCVSNWKRSRAVSDVNEPVVVEREPMTVVGMSLTGKMGDSTGIGELWNAFMARAGEVTPGETVKEAFGVFSATPEQAAAGMMDYMAGAPVKPGIAVPEGMVCKDIPGGSFVTYTHKGGMDGLQDSFRTLYGWIASSGYTAEGRPGYELYDERFKPTSQENEIDLFVPVKPA